MQANGGTRVRPGVAQRVWRTHHDWMFLDRDPKSFRDHETPDPVIQIWLEDVFGDDARSGRLKVAMHPHLGRWALFERHFDPAKGSDLYQCIFICSEAPELNADGLPVIPVDYVGDKFLECFSVYVGEYRHFNKKDFEEIEQFNRLKYGVDGSLQNVDAPKEAEEKEAKRVEADRLRDFMDYYWNQAQTDANKDAGCMGSPVFIQDPDRDKVKEDNYVIVDKGGYKIKAKKGSIWENVVKNDPEAVGEFMDEHANPRTTDEKSHINDWEKAPKIELPEVQETVEEVLEQVLEKVPVKV